MYIDHSKPPFIDITLPSGITLPCHVLVIMYSSVLVLDYVILCNQSLRQHSKYYLSILHVLIPLIFTCQYRRLNILFAALPWFLVSYSARMPLDTLSFADWFQSLLAITIDSQAPDIPISKRRMKGAAKIALGIFKLVFSRLVVYWLLPRHSEDVLQYNWLHPYSLFYTLLYGIQAYCLLGAIEIAMGLQQLISGWNIMDINHYPILATSPREFWSRRWNMVIHNLLHAHVFTYTNKNTIQEPATVSVVIKKKKTVKTRTVKKAVKPTSSNRRITRSAAKAALTNIISVDEIEQELDEIFFKEKPAMTTKYDLKPTLDQHQSSFWSTQRGRGLLAFVVSGVFHELILMSACRKLTLEQLTFFILEGLIVMFEVELRQGVYKQQPRGKARLVCIILHLFSIAIIGRLFMAPFLRYQFFK